MNYIFLVAGKGARLQPLTFSTPKSQYKLDKNTTILQRMISKIYKFDKEAKFVVVGGYLYDYIISGLENIPNIEFLYNPFYDVTNSIASLWFAKDFMDGEVVIINGDIVVEEALVKEVICDKEVTRPLVLVDSSIKSDGDYNVQVFDERVLVMSKNLDSYFGEYAGITKLDKKSVLLLRDKVEKMIKNGMYDQWYENAIVQMIFDEDFLLYYKDICSYKWTEVDCVSDMLLARMIHNSENL